MEAHKAFSMKRIAYESTSFQSDYPEWLFQQYLRSNDIDYVTSVLETIEQRGLNARLYGSAYYDPKMYDDIDLFVVGQPKQLRDFSYELRVFNETGRQFGVNIPGDTIYSNVEIPVSIDGKRPHHHLVMERIILDPMEPTTSPIDLSLISNGNFNRLRGIKSKVF